MIKIIWHSGPDLECITKKVEDDANHWALKGYRETGPATLDILKRAGNYQSPDYEGWIYTMTLTMEKGK